MATIDDVVKESGVSRSTVFRFLNGQNVREDSKKQIIKAMKKLNYKTEQIKKYSNISIEISICQDYSDFQGFAEIVNGIMERAQETGIRVYLSRRTGSQIEQDYTKWNNKGGVNGVLVVGKNKTDELKEAELLTDRNVPHIFINRKMYDESISYVSADVEQGAYDIVAYLAKLGHKKILTAGNPDELLIDEQKMKGYRKALEDNGIEFKEEFYLNILDKKELEDRIKEVFEKGHIPTAYFGLCDSDSIQFINIARSFGYKVPRDISVVGMDDINMASYCIPSLTTIAIPFKDMGRLAVDQLLQLMNNKIKSIRTTVNHNLVVRESCKDTK